MDALGWDALLAGGDGTAPLADDEVRVWSARVDACPLETRALDAVLDDGERARAARFHAAVDRRRFAVAHAFLRGVLGLHLGVAPSSVQLRNGAHGKPALMADGCMLRFNMAHAHALVVCALARGREVGIDTEWTGRAVEALRIAERFFAAAERAALREVPPEQQQQAFYACWTRKEAYVKGRGIGLGLPLDGFAVSIDPGPGTCTLVTAHEPDAAARWSLRSLALEPGYETAVAVESAGAPWHARTLRVG